MLLKVQQLNRFLCFWNSQSLKCANELYESLGVDEEKKYYMQHFSNLVVHMVCFLEMHINYLSQDTSDLPNKI